MLKQTLFLCGALLAVCLRAGAAGVDEPELDSRLTHYYLNYHINADASHVETYDWAAKVLQARAVERLKSQSISYSTSIQKAEILHAYTLKADGRRIDVPKNNYQLEVNGGRDKDAPVFSDITTLTVVFPEVAVGDSVAFAYRVTQTEPMFPGHFSVMNTFSKLRAFDDAKVTIGAPASLVAQHEARQMAEQRTEHDGRVTLQWTFQNTQPIKSKRQDWSVYEIEKEPGYAYSTFKSYAEIAEAYGARARSKAAVTERVQKLAGEIVQDRKTPREQAQALYDWVATNITYAGNCIGVGAVVPHDIPFILDNRMGDCKDHATLLQALLAARGIESTQALVNAGGIYTLPKIPVVSSVNHVINYLPGLKLFADSTSQTTPFGMLPFSDVGKPVLLVDGFREGVRTPVPAIGSNRQHMKTTVRIGADGSAQGEIDVSLNGIFAETTRASLRHMPMDRLDEVVENVFRGMGYIGSGKALLDDPKALLDSYHYKVKFEVKDLVSLPGPGAIQIYPLFNTEAPVQHYMLAATEPIESVDTVCRSGTSVEEYTYLFPRNMKILSVPDDMKLANDFLTYRATYRLKGNTLTVKRTMDDRTPGNICSPAMASAYKKFAIQVARNVKAQVVYK
jgi:transglutaminase-like putative cysteine protease